MSLTASPSPETAAPARRPHIGALSKSALRHAGDDRLVALTRAGSERAFAEIMRRYERPLQFYCLHMVGAPRAEDAVQQAFMQAFVALRDGERREIALRPWLYRIARNCAIDLLRKQPYEHDQLDPEFDGTAQPPGLVEQKEELARIVAAIQALPERQRRALTLRELEGRSYGEISAELGHTDSGVRQLIFRARTALRNLGAFFLPLGSIRWRLLGAPSAGADPHQLVAAATVSSGSSTVVQAAASVVVATLALVGAGAPAGGRQGDRAAAAGAGYSATVRPASSAGTGEAGTGGSRAVGPYHSDAVSGPTGGAKAFGPAAVTPGEAAPPADPIVVAAGGDRPTSGTQSADQPQKLETLDASPDSSATPAGDGGTTGDSGPAPAEGDTGASGASPGDAPSTGGSQPSPPLSSGGSSASGPPATGGSSPSGSPASGGATGGPSGGAHSPRRGGQSDDQSTRGAGRPKPVARRHQRRS
jgi:RNA polymerase sigma factor (sigma-70 family)